MDAKARKSPTRLRKVTCEECGYTIRMARSWMTVGLPTCPCGQGMRPESPADLAYVGLIGPEDMPAPMWTQICYENNWTDSIQRKGAAAKAYQAKLAAHGGILGRRVGAGHCAYAGCGLWVANGGDYCSAGHAQHEGLEAVRELDAIPF